MNLDALLLANGFFLTLVLAILLGILAKQNGHKPKKSKVKDDIKKIKEQINSK